MPDMSFAACVPTQYVCAWRRRCHHCPHPPPIFIVNGYTVSTPAVSAAEESVERRLVRESLRQTDMTFVERLITLDTLAAADEIFTADHRGITSIARIGRKPYMSIIAERVASRIENVTL